MDKNTRTYYTEVATPLYEEKGAAITVDDIEVAQFIYLLLNRKKLRNVINAVTKRGVLLLGGFKDDGLEVLGAIAKKLRELDYLPIIFDFDRPDSRDYTETIRILAGLSRFVIVELSGPSVPQELYSVVPHLDIPFVPIIKSNTNPFSLFVDLLKFPWVLKPLITYSSLEDLLGSLPENVILPAEKRHSERQRLLDEIFK